MGASSQKSQIDGLIGITERGEPGVALPAKTNDSPDLSGKMDACVKKRGGGQKEGRRDKAYKSEEITTKADWHWEKDEVMRRYTCTCTMRER